MSDSRNPQFLHPGGHTAYGSMIEYRLGKLRERGVLRGDWLDLGCADGYWSVALAEWGVDSVIGVEAIEAYIEKAQELPHPPNVTFQAAKGEQLPFEDDRFDGVFLNEVLEHVTDEAATLREIARVLRPGGHLALFSPNRWFPFEGHGARLNEDRVLMSRPVPLMPWLPARITKRFATARNYWPRELRGLVEDAGMEIVSSEWALVQFEQYPWIPESLAERYRRNIRRIENSPAARLLAVSTFIVARA